MKGAVLMLLAAAGAMLLAWWTLAAPERQALAHVAPGAIAETVVARAMLEPLDGAAKVRARVDGRVTAVFVRAGQRVEAGAPLARIGNESLDAEVTRRQLEADAAEQAAASVREGARPEEAAALEAELGAARQELALARDRLARQEALQRKRGTTDEAVTEARRTAAAAQGRVEASAARARLARAGGRPSDLQAALARAAAARAAVAQAKDLLTYAALNAPVSGVVLSRRIDPGDVVTTFEQSPVLFEIADPARVELRAEVEELDAVKLTVGLPVDVGLSGEPGVLATGTVTRLGQRMERRVIGASDARQRADSLVRPVWCSLTPAAASHPGWPLDYRFEVAIRLPSVLVQTRLPRSAVRLSNGRALVRQPGFPWPAEQAIRLGIVDGSFVQVLGMAVGTPVLASW